MASFTLDRSPLNRSSIHTSIYTSIEVLNALETAASTVTTLPTGTAWLKATWFTDAVTVIRLLCLLAAMLAARSMRANNSPPKRLFRGFVSLGNTISVIKVRDSLGVFGCIGSILSKDTLLIRKGREKYDYFTERNQASGDSVRLIFLNCFRASWASS